jgi:hypothetical protein
LQLYWQASKPHVHTHFESHLVVPDPVGQLKHVDAVQPQVKQQVIDCCQTTAAAAGHRLLLLPRHRRLLLLHALVQR